MTRERLVEILDDHQVYDVEAAADDLIAEMAGEWPSEAEVAHALFMADTGRANSLRLEADGYYRKLARAVIALFTKERS